ncbi:MAG: M24 family metallopeptidase [bacterium]|nr:M24 family metallopeptidase [bacterium]
MISFAFEKRIVAFQGTVPADSAVLLADPQHIRYLTGFESLAPGEREAFLVVTSSTATLLYASFSPVSKISSITSVPKCSIAAVLEQLPTPSTVAVDMSALTAQEYQVLQTSAHTLSKWDSSKLWQQRMRKDAQELEVIAQAVAITQKVLEESLAKLQPGMTELTVRRQLEANLLLAGADAMAFPTIVAFGEHSALPHHQPTEKKLEKEMAVLIDCGAKVAGYCADMTRTIWFGDAPDPEFVKITEIVQQAFAAAQAVLKMENLTAKDVDAAARKVITDAGYGEKFIHTTGHGLGLSIHEPPSLSGRTEQAIEPGMVITIEPGIYLVGRFGVRYEETVEL